jgi:hypothetical protein
VPTENTKIKGPKGLWCAEATDTATRGSQLTSQGLWCAEATDTATRGSSLALYGAPSYYDLASRRAARFGWGLGRQVCLHKPIHIARQRFVSGRFI